MKHHKGKIIGFVILAGLFVTWLVTSYLMSMQARSAIPIPLTFTGEYCQGNDEWKPLSGSTTINALDGELRLHGHFNDVFPQTNLHFYLEHLEAWLIVNDQEPILLTLSDHEWSQEDWNVKWLNWYNESITSDDTVEIRLINHHPLGNPRAYQDFLTNLFMGNTKTFENFILHPLDFMMRSQNEFTMLEDVLVCGQLWRTLGTFIIVLSLLLLGVAFADDVTASLFGDSLWSMGGLSLFAGGLMWLDTMDSSLLAMPADLAVCGAQICRMMIGLCMGMYVTTFLNGKWKTANQIAAMVVGFADAVITLLCLRGTVLLRNTLIPWCTLQGMWLVLMSLGCMIRLRQVERKIAPQLYAALLLLVTMGMELLNARFGWWHRGIGFNTVFLATFIVFLVWTVRSVPQAYRAQKRVTEQENELIQSRVAITLSQIQPHFLYNALTAIARLCDLDPQKAKKTTVDFSEYLRGNLDSLTQTLPVPFSTELKHTQIYLDIEKVRFGDKLNVEYDIGAEDFMIPSLSVQPLVENAVKYGLGKKKEGGTIWLSTKEEANGWRVTIRDDGAGFDRSEPVSDGRSHIGIENVRRRVEMQSKGTLDIQSRLEIGTKAEIWIPKGDIVNDDSMCGRRTAGA
ncbi:MAG: histidine kinase [Eubacteriales bacterium]|nr:histidine kinase [Eubacteriales bacterium]